MICGSGGGNSSGSVGSSCGNDGSGCGNGGSGCGSGCNSCGRKKVETEVDVMTTSCSMFWARPQFGPHLSSAAVNRLSRFFCLSTEP